MAMYHLWYPNIRLQSTGSSILEFLLTGGDAGQVGYPDTSFIYTLFEEQGIEGKILSWSAKVGRTDYFTDYLEENNWVDIWQKLVVVRVEIEGAITTTIFTDSILFETNVTPYFPSSIDARSSNCFILSDFKNLRSLEHSKELIRQQFSIQKAHRVDSNMREPLFSDFSLKSGYYHLQIDLGNFDEEFFVQGAIYAQKISNICKQNNGTSNVDEVFDVLV